MLDGKLVVVGDVKSCSTNAMRDKLVAIRCTVLAIDVFCAHLFCNKSFVQFCKEREKSHIYVSTMHFCSNGH